MSTLTDPAGGQRLEAYLYTHIPLVRSMQLRVDRWDADGLSLSAPLNANINHEGTAFGGSLASLATLACWGLLWLLLEREPHTHIVVADTHMRFLHPVKGALQAECPRPDTEGLKTFLDTLHHHRKAGMALQCRIVEREIVCATLDGRFAAQRIETHTG